MSDVVEAILEEPPVKQIAPKQKLSSLFKDLLSLIGPYWKSEEKVFAWTMLISVLGLNLVGIYCTVLINQWYANFYNALQALDKASFTSLLLQFFIIVIAYIAILVTESFMQSYLAFKWRVWLTKQTMDQWLHNSNFCKLFTYKTKVENPDQRISQDISVFTSSTLSLSLSIITQLIKSVTFATILWTLSSSLLLPLPGGRQLDVPGYMLWLTIIYVAFSTFVIFKTGRPLVKLDYAQEKVEADFRFSLMRIRERRDEVSMLDGAKAEKNFLTDGLSAVIKNYKQIIVRNIYVNSFQNIFLNLTTVLPILAASPMFFSGAITLGVLMQIGNTFNQVEGALMIFAINFQAFASWKATFNRIVDFRAELGDIKNKEEKHGSDLSVKRSNETKSLTVNNVTINLPESQNLAKFDFKVMPGERVLIMGRSGFGKSTLLKCIAGHWPYAAGLIERPEQLMIVPQKPYFPINTLRNCLLYPHLDAEISDQELSRVLEVCSLEILKGRLDDVADWLSMLSLGEQQRLNFARIILAKPQWVLMDEPTASMDKALESNLFNTLFTELPNVTVLTIGHAPSLKDLHTRCIEL